ncbi:hypothetical protein CVT25_009172 [Psilocybe cyanescens]|uniref:Helicase ATP-binding domain-containing protein n=1 Tax=Psilocybe cyanescens TaxID=93625 RepID=A0A409VRX5_PSICY|nr:hypothetical protein CVT25_009172 [Psilocybe cyanescens]
MDIKRIDSDEEESASVSLWNAKEKKAVTRHVEPFDPNPLKKYFAGMSGFLSVSDCEADEEDNPEEDTPGSNDDDNDASKGVDRFDFLKISSVKPSTSRAKSTSVAEDDSVTESSSYRERRSSSASQLSDRASVGAGKGKAIAKGNVSDSVTESQSDVAPAAQMPPKLRAKSPAKPILSSVAQGKLPQIQAGESDSVTESESEPELDLKSTKLKPRPSIPLKPGQTVQKAFLLDEKKRVKIPATINTYLRDYQRDGVKFLYRQYKAGKGGLLGDDMGLVSHLTSNLRVGKTIQTIAFLSAIMQKTGLVTDRHRRRKYVFKLQDNKNWRREMPRADAKWPTCLIIAPSSVAGNWEREFEKWGYFEVGMYLGPVSERETVLKDFKLGRLDVVITSFDLARRYIADLEDLAFTCVIIDEVHRVKDKKTKISQAFDQFESLRRFGLTGTAIQNSYDELWAILDWTNPGELGTLKQWRGYVNKPLTAAQSTTANEETRAVGMSVALILKDKLLPDFFLRRTKDIIKNQMPKKIDQVVFCPLTRLQTEAYQNILATPAVRNLVQRDEPCDCGSRKARKDCHHKFVAADVFRYMSVLIKLSNHLALIMPGGPKDSPEQVKANRELAHIAFPGDKYRSLPSYGQISMMPEACGKWAVLDALLKNWRTDKTNKVLIFTKSVKLLEMLEHYLKMQFYSHLKLDGSTKQESRMDIVDQFNNDPSIYIFLISTAAGGTGLNLTGANKVVVFGELMPFHKLISSWCANPFYASQDPNWNPALDLQAMDRAFRIGQLRDVTVYRLLGSGSVEELIYARQIYKQQQMAIGYDASIQTRYFEGVQGDNAKKGELFGLENIFKLQQDKVATQMVIENAHIAELDWALANMEKQRGKKNSTNELVEAAGQFKDEDTGVREDKNDTLKGLGLLLFDDNVPQRDAIEETLKQIGVKYTHKNDDIIAPSNVEAMKAQQTLQNLRKRKRESASASGSTVLAKGGKTKVMGTGKTKVASKPSAPWPPPNRGRNKNAAPLTPQQQLERRRVALVATGAISCLADLPKFAQEFLTMSEEEQKQALAMVDEAYENRQKQDSSSD